MYQSPAINPSHEPSIETGYHVDYECACGAEWSTRWSCACDDDCPECGAATQASDWSLDGTYTQDQLDIYNSTGIMPKD